MCELYAVYALSANSRTMHCVYTNYSHDLMYTIMHLIIIIQHYNKHDSEIGNSA